MRTKCLTFVLLLHLLVCAAKKMPQGHLEPLGNSGTIRPVDKVEGFIPPKVFIQQYLEKNKPLHMVGAAKVSPAFHLWSDAYMRSKTPVGKDGNVFVEFGKKENRSDPSQDMHFTKFLDTYNSSNMYMVHHVPMFLQQDIIMPFSIQCDEFEKSFADTVMWFSSGGTKSVLHNDNFENINCLYRGRKRLIFINITKYADLQEKLTDNKEFGHSTVDVERVDLDKYPFFSGMEFHSVEMEPGDCLYIPLAWFHHVESFHSNLAVNVWFNTKKKIDLSTCRDEFDKSLLLSKFNFVMKNEDEEKEEETPEKKTSKKKKDVKNDVAPQDAEIVMGNLMSFIVPEPGSSVSKAQFMRMMTEEKKISSTAQGILEVIFKAVDSNGDGNVNDVDVDAKLVGRRGEVLVKAARKWQTLAKKLGIKVDLFKVEPREGEEDETEREESKPVIETPEERSREAVFENTLISSVGPNDEL